MVVGLNMARAMKLPLEWTSRTPLRKVRLPKSSRNLADRRSLRHTGINRVPSNMNETPPELAAGNLNLVKVSCCRGSISKHFSVRIRN